MPDLRKNPEIKAITLCVPYPYTVLPSTADPPVFNTQCPFNTQTWSFSIFATQHISFTLFSAYSLIFHVFIYYSKEGGLTWLQSFFVSAA